MIGCLTRGTLDLFMAFVTDEQDLVIVACEPYRFTMHLRHQRARRIDRAQTSFGGGVNDSRRHPVSAEDDVGTGGHFIDLLDEDRALLLEFNDDVNVVHDLFTHVHRSTVMLESLLNGYDSAIDTGAVPSRGR